MPTKLGQGPLSGKTGRTRKDTFPLFRRSDGRWCKKIRGQQRYFGYDRDEALAKYQSEIGLLSQGIEPDEGDIGLRELFNRYLTAKQRATESGEMGPRSLADSVATLRRVLSTLGDRLVSTLASGDFATLKVRLAKHRSIITVSGDVRRTKAAFNWALREGLIRALPRYGDEFKPAPMRAVRLAKSQRAAQMFQADELRKVLQGAGPQLRAMIYLGTNCALLPIDVARLTFDEINLNAGWLRQPRGKTGVDRLAWLWPETVAAVRAAIKLRPKPAEPQFSELVFLTESGLPVVRTIVPAKAKHNPKAAMGATIISRVTSDFREVQQACGVYRKGRGFGALRHGFLKTAEAGRDFPAVAKVMGHALPGVSSHYREHIGQDRIKAVCELVRAWLFATVKKRKAK